MLEYNQDWIGDHIDELYDVIDQLQATLNDADFDITLSEYKGTIKMQCNDYTWVVDKDDTQRRCFNQIIQKVCKQHPQLIDAIVANLTLYALIKPIKSGKVDGEQVHNKYWTFQENIERSTRNL